MVSKVVKEKKTKTHLARSLHDKNNSNSFNFSASRNDVGKNE